MKLKYLILLVITIAASGIAYSQKAPASKPAAKAPSKKLVKCHIPSDKEVTLKITLDQAKAWADSVPLQLICNDLKPYKLYNFEFTIMKFSPMESKEFGTGNGGIPILARRAIDDLQPKDGIIIKNATYLDEKGMEQPLPIITFSIVEAETAK